MDLWDLGHELKSGQNHTVEIRSCRARVGARPEGSGLRCAHARGPWLLCADGSRGHSWSPSKWNLSPDGCSWGPHILPMSCQKAQQPAPKRAAASQHSSGRGACTHPEVGTGETGKGKSRRTEQAFCGHALIMGMTSEATPHGSPL